MKGKNNIASKVFGIVKPVADEQDLYLWDVEYVKEGADKYLRITIDREDGVNIEDCEKFHRAIDPILDEADPIPESYILEVSSPGIERELKCDEHILACEDWDVEVKLYAPMNGTKSLRGRLVGLSEDGAAVIVENAAGLIQIEKEKIAKISTYYDFDN